MNEISTEVQLYKYLLDVVTYTGDAGMGKEEQNGKIRNTKN